MHSSLLSYTYTRIFSSASNNSKGKGKSSGAMPPPPAPIYHSVDEDDQIFDGDSIENNKLHDGHLPPSSIVEGDDTTIPVPMDSRGRSSSISRSSTRLVTPSSISTPLYPNFPSPNLSTMDLDASHVMSVLKEAIDAQEILNVEYDLEPAPSVEDDEHEVAPSADDSLDFIERHLLEDLDSGRRESSPSRIERELDEESNSPILLPVAETQSNAEIPSIVQEEVQAPSELTSAIAQTDAEPAEYESTDATHTDLPVSTSSRSPFSDVDAPQNRSPKIPEPTLHQYNTEYKNQDNREANTPARGFSIEAPTDSESLYEDGGAPPDTESVETVRDFQRRDPSILREAAPLSEAIRGEPLPVENRRFPSPTRTQTHSTTVTPSNRRYTLLHAPSRPEVHPINRGYLHSRSPPPRWLELKVPSRRGIIHTGQPEAGPSRLGILSQVSASAAQNTAPSHREVKRRKHDRRRHRDETPTRETRKKRLTILLPPSSSLRTTLKHESSSSASGSPVRSPSRESSLTISSASSTPPVNYQNLGSSSTCHCHDCQYGTQSVNQHSHFTNGYADPRYLVRDYFDRQPVVAPVKDWGRDSQMS